MKLSFKKIGLFILLGLSIVSCDSSSDSVTPTVVPSTFDFIYVKAPNAATGNCGLWNLKKEVTAGSTFLSPINLRSDDFSTVASTIPSSTLMANQCSAYDKISKRYVVSSGERVIVYNFNTVSGSPTIEFQYPIANIQAMEFANGRFFFIKNNILMEGDITTGTVIPSFSSITLASGQVSNLTQKGNYICVISGGHFYAFDITATTPTIIDHVLSTTDIYEGLEAINSAGSPFSLYVVKRNSSGNELQKITLTSSLTFASITPLYTLTFTNDLSSKISSALDYTTEFYYINSSNGPTSDSNSLTVVDLTPTNPSSYSPTTVLNPGNHYLFGLQLKD